MILDLFLLRVFHAPSYCSFTSNLTTCFTKKILNPKYHTSTLMLVLENVVVVALEVIVSKIVQLSPVNISVAFQQF
jgi:hypothetical protein